MTYQKMSGQPYRPTRLPCSCVGGPSVMASPAAFPLSFRPERLRVAEKPTVAVIVVVSIEHNARRHEIPRLRSG